LKVMFDLRTGDAMFGVIETTDIESPAIVTVFELSSAELTLTVTVDVDVPALNFFVVHLT
jgi:hypothetical protein